MGDEIVVLNLSCTGRESVRVGRSMIVINDDYDVVLSDFYSVEEPLF